MSKRSSLLKSIASTITDYRAGEITTPTPQHVERWVNQFDSDVQERILAEVNHVLNRTYISKTAVEKFLSSLVNNKDLAGSDPCSFWESVEFLDIQGQGNSQREIVADVRLISQRSVRLGDRRLRQGP